MYFLDSNTCIELLKGRYKSVSQKLLSTIPSEIKIPSLVKAELLTGALKSAKPKENRNAVELLLQPFEIIPFINEMTYLYAEIRSDLETRGLSIGPNDLIIATICKYYDGIFVTDNVKEFSRIKDFKFENWVSRN